jgi:rod shape-determining protein MreD
MNSRFRNILLGVLVIGQIAIARNYHSWRFNIDLLFLIIFYIAIRSGFLSSVLSAAFIGLCSDYLSGGVMGVFSFSRTLAAYFLNILARFLDLKKNVFVFLLIFLSLFFSNLLAFMFYVLIFKFKITASLLLFQPLSTAIVGTIVLGFEKVKSLLDVS